MSEPLTCPWCGGVEPNAFLLQNNHWVKLEDETGYDWCKAHGMCIAMSLTQNHVLSYGERLQGQRANDYPVCDCHRTYDRDCGRVALARAIDRAADVWPPERAGWLDYWRPLAREREAPNHAPMAESEDAELFGALT